MSCENVQTLRMFVQTAAQSRINLRFAHINDKLWALYIHSLNKAYDLDPSYRMKTMVSIIGKQPDSNVWVPYLLD